MNKAQLVARVSGKANMTQADTKRVIEALTDTIKEVVTDESITLVGFGTFSIKQMNARTGRNPQTGAAIQIAASKKIVFKPGKEFKESVNG